MSDAKSADASNDIYLSSTSISGGGNLSINEAVHLHSNKAVDLSTDEAAVLCTDEVAVLSTNETADLSTAVLPIQSTYISMHGHSNNLVQRLLDLAILFLLSCLYSSMTELAKEKPRIVLHLWTIIFKQASPASSSTFPIHAH